MDILEPMFFLHETPEADLPQKVYLEPTTLCNLHCKICFRHGWIGERLGHMSDECFCAARDQILQIPSVEEVFFGGMGEPLFHPQIVQMVASLAPLRRSMVTNGTMLTEALSAQLVQAGLSELWVSMDGFEAAAYERIQLGSRFTTILKNLEQFNRARAGAQTRLGVTFVITPENLDQLEKINAFCDRYSVDQINLSHMIPGAPVEKEKLFTLFERDIPVGQMRRLGEPSAAAAPHTCPFVSRRAVFIRWDGDVAPCMQLLHGCHTYLYEQKRTIRRFAYGNILQTPLYDCWNSAAYAAFRRRVRTFYFPFCMDCWGCEDRETNLCDCFLGEAPTCGACLWSTGKIFCP